MPNKWHSIPDNCKEMNLHIITTDCLNYFLRWFKDFFRGRKRVIFKFSRIYSQRIDIHPFTL